MGTSVVQNGTATVVETPEKVLRVSMLPGGKFTVVGVDIDTTGRRLIDEIVQLAAYSPVDHFEQYIMPYMNLNPAARQRHQVRVISIGFYRMLKSMQTYKIIKSKSEIAALKDFLEWLEALKAKDANSQGIILVYHEERKFIPYMILESLKKYNLLDRFLASVKAFANGLDLAKDNANESLQHLSLRKLSKVLNAKTIGDGAVTSTVVVDEKKSGDAGQPERDFFDGNAAVRARLAFEVAQQMSQEVNKEAIAASDMDLLLTAIRPYAVPVELDLKELDTQNQNLERQNSFRPVFLNYFKTTLYHRVRAVKFRIILAENGHDLSALQDLWQEKKRDGIADVLQAIEELKVEDKAELVELFDSFFDPNKAPIKPIVKTSPTNNNNRRRNRRNTRNSNGNGNGNGNGSAGGQMKNEGNNAPRGNAGEQGAGGDKQVIVGQADSTTKSPTPPRGGRNNSNNHTSNGNGHGGANGHGGGNGNNGGGNGHKAQRPRRPHPRARHNAMKNAGPAVNMASNVVPVVAANC